MAAFVPYLISGISALAGGLANRGNTSKQTQDTKSSTTSSSTTAPQYDDAMLNIRNLLLRSFQGATEDTPDFQTGYVNNGISNINKAAGATSNAIRQAMITRGLGRTSAGISPEVASEASRFGQIADFTNKAPLAMDEIRRNRLKDFSQFFATLPVGTTQNGTSNTTGNATGTQTTPGNQLGGALSGLGNMAAFLYGKGMFGGGSGSNYDQFDPLKGTFQG